MGYDIKEKKVNKHTQDYVAWISQLPANKTKSLFFVSQTNLEFNFDFNCVYVFVILRYKGTTGA